MQNRNRREWSRHPIRLPVNMVMDGQLMDGLSRNLSMGGMFVELLDTPPSLPIDSWVDETVTLTFTPPGHTMEIVTEGVVCWNNGERGMGIRFKALGAWAQTALEEILERRIMPSVSAGADATAPGPTSAP